jgi:FkbM family methyltransferase
MNDSDLALVETNGCHLLCYRDENFAVRLPDYTGDAAALLRGLCLETMPVKQASHSHVKLFASLVDELAGPAGAWKMLDVGGYIGAIGLPIARWAAARGSAVGSAVEIFEPTEMATLIDRSVALNRLADMVRVHRYAASDTLGHAVFSSSENQRVAGRLGGQKTERSFMVETMPLDRMYADLSGQLVIAKIDTEGHEPRVLEGMRQVLERNRCALILEFHEFCLGTPIAGQRYEDFLFERFRLLNVGNIGYPRRLEPIDDGDVAALRGFANRDGNKLTDIICFDKRLPQSAVDRVVRPYLPA